MFRNYMMTALRNLLRYRQYTLINIFGLAVGLAACLLILLYVNFELSYDRWIPENERVMRFETRMYDRGGNFTYNSDRIPPVTALIFAEQFPEIELYSRFLNQSVAVALDGKAFEQRVTIADPDVFELMGIKLIEGDAATALSSPDSLVLQESDAKRLFGDSPALGQIVRIDGTFPMKITGVMPDWPVASDLRVGALAPFSGPIVDYQPWVRHEWGSFWGPTYVRLAEGTDPEVLAADVNEFARRVGPADRYQERIDKGIQPSYEFHLTRAIDAHLQGDISGGDGRASIVRLWAAGIVALLILSIAAVNVANLGTMLAIKRVREVAIRKALGASGRQLVVQLLAESVALTLVAMMIGIALAELMLPMFGQLMDRALTSDLIYTSPMLAGLLGGAVIVGCICGLYPALVAARFRPVDYLSGMKPTLGVWLRNSLVILQFAATIGLLVTCIVVFMQAQFARTLDKGFQSEQLVAISGISKPMILEREAALREALARVPGVEAVAASHDMPDENQYTNNSGIRTDTGVEKSLRRVAVSEELLPLMGAKLLAGRLFSKDRSADSGVEENALASASVILNEKAIKDLGFERPEDAIGHEIYSPGDVRSTIVGVIANLRTRSARSEPMATYYWVGPSEYRYIVLRVAPQNMPQTLAAIDRTWREFFPELPIDRQFADDAFTQFYDTDRRQGWLLLFSGGVMVVIAVMGLYALAALSTERRSREIGIRKVLGARTLNIVQLLLWQFSLPVLLANLIAWPIAWWSLSRWLEGFVDRIALSPVPFLIAGLGVLAIAWITIIGHTVRVARATPINALRYE
ncbi:ABC transporter permease [Kordiimonas gwangyangensis]|uniref:ABC transporter permease n=1 Tax=Kordiimonas gwangyangensis TaxID=288022 RepID=UPI0003761E18|nr:ABC transporter permease [Kordiimonas gwangyangensis]